MPKQNIPSEQYLRANKICLVWPDLLEFRKKTGRDPDGRPADYWIKQGYTEILADL